MKPENPAIGEVECPYKLCPQKCKVYGFKPRTEGRKSVFTGKKYLVCPDHGRIGADGSQKVTDYILENGTIWGAKKPESIGVNPQKPASAKPSLENPKNPQSTPVRKPEPSPPASRKTPDPSPQNPKPKWWETIL